MHNFSCADFTFPLLSTDQTLKLLRLLKISAVDIGLFARSTHFHPENLTPNPGEYAKRVLAALSDNGLIAADLFLQIGAEPSICSANDPDPSVRASNRDVFQAAVEVAAQIGCKHMTGLPGVYHSDMDKSEAFRLAAQEAAWRVEIARRVGIIYAIEAHLGSICPDPESAQRLLHAVDGLTLTLDYGHFVSAGIPNETVHPLVPYASHVHLRCGCPGQLQTTLSNNTIDFAGLVKRLAERNYAGYLCLEYVWIDWQGCNRTDNISETLLLRRQIEASLGA